MKKVITILITLVLVASLFGCSATKEPPKDVSEKMYEYGVAALEICDDFLNNDIDENTAKVKIDQIYENAKYYNQKKYEEFGVETYYEISDYQYKKDSFIESDIYLISSDLTLRSISGTPSKEKITEKRDKLAKDLNKK